MCNKRLRKEQEGENLHLMNDALGRYLEIFNDYIDTQNEEALLQAADFGRELVTRNFPLENLLILHESALNELVQSQPELKLKEVIQIINQPFSELMMAYALTFYAHLEMRQKLAETQIIEKERNRLQFLVEERTIKLKEAKEQAEVASQAKSQFLMKVSHELRTPMHAILSFAKLGIEKTDPSNPAPISREKLFSYFGRIVQSGERLLDLLNDLLDLSRIESGKMQFKFQKMDFQLLLQSLQNEYSALLNEKRIDLEIKVTDSYRSEINTLYFDPPKMVQVLKNLFSNAVKFTPANGMINVTISSYHEATQTYLKCEVIDSGMGIPEVELDMIFDKFVQGSNNTKMHGTGLGLAICREIIKAHAGRIWAENREHGACFVFILPQKELTNQMTEIQTTP